MLYRTLKRLIELEKTEGLAEKIDVFYATGKLTETEYNELIEMLRKDEIDEILVAEGREDLIV